MHHNIKSQSDPNTYRYMMVNMYLYIVTACRYMQLPSNYCEPKESWVLILALLNFSWKYPKLCTLYGTSISLARVMTLTGSMPKEFDAS